MQYFIEWLNLCCLNTNDMCLQKSHKSSNFIINSSKPFAMKSAILLLALSAIVFSSCTTAYKSGQTPDDVYYSPARPQDEYVKAERNDDRYSDDYYEDRYLRMKVQNRYRWNDLDDWYGSERRYRYNVYSSYGLYNEPWNPHTYWNSYYNPYYYSGSNIKTVAYTKPRTFNLNTYNSNTSNNQQSNNKFRNTNTYTESRNSNSNSGNFLRNIFTGNNNSSSGSKVNTSSSNSNTNSSSGSSSGSSGSTAPVRKF